MVDLSRRTFVASTAAAARMAPHAHLAAAAPPASPLTPAPPIPDEVDPVTVHWLECGMPAPSAAGTPWGVPWAKGALPAEQTFSLTTEDRTAGPLQTWPLGYRPDGTLKWSAVSGSDAAPRAEKYTLAPGEPVAGEHTVTVNENRGRVVVDTGAITVEFRSAGRHVISSIKRGSQVIARDGRLVCSTQDALPGEASKAIASQDYESMIDTVTVEQKGPVRAVIERKRGA